MGNSNQWMQLRVEAAFFFHCYVFLVFFHSKSHSLEIVINQSCVPWHWREKSACGMAHIPLLEPKLFPTSVGNSHDMQAALVSDLMPGGMWSVFINQHLWAAIRFLKEVMPYKSSIGMMISLDIYMRKWCFRPSNFKWLYILLFMLKDLTFPCLDNFQNSLITKRSYWTKQVVFAS